MKTAKQPTKRKPAKKTESVTHLIKSLAKEHKLHHITMDEVPQWGKQPATKDQREAYKNKIDPMPEPTIQCLSNDRHIGHIDMDKMNPQEIANFFFDFMVGYEDKMPETLKLFTDRILDRLSNDAERRSEQASIAHKRFDEALMNVKKFNTQPSIK